MDCRLTVFFTITVAVFNAALSNVNPKITCPGALTIPEDTPVDSLIFNCSATDGDDSSTADGTIGYNFFGGNQARMFSLDAATCKGYLAKPLEYTDGKSYPLTLRATDGGGLSDDCKFTISVNDGNNNAPTCKQNLVYGTLDENVPVYTSFTTLSCSDKDTPPGGNVFYEVILGNSSNSRSDTIGVGVTNGSLFILRQIDYDKEPDTFQAMVIVRDGGSPGLSITVTAVLSVKDLDDNPPKLSDTTYQAEVVENAMLGTTVVRINATDPDQPNTPASQITYTSVCKPDSLMIDRTSGDLIVTKDLDYEKDQTVNCTVYAFSEKSTTSTAIVIITVKDTNDGVPKFEQPYYMAMVYENAPLDTSIITVTAIDPENSNITYALNSAIFKIDPVSGKVMIKTPPDYETQTSYLESITATDSGNPPMSASVFLRMSITPQNEFDPEFIGNCSGSVEENSQQGTSVVQLYGKDNDTGHDGQIRFEIVSNDTPFFIDSSTGYIGTNAEIDYEKKSSYTFTVAVYDLSTTAVRSALQTCIVTVKDMNDQSVECSPTPVTVVQYPFPIQQTVAKVNCTGSNSAGVPLKYDIASGNDNNTFKIDPATGAVTLLSIPLTQQYYLNVNVTSGADSTFTTLIVFAEQELKMTNLPNSINITEGQPGRLIFTVTACCAFPRVEYQLVSGNDDNKVTSTPSNGEVRVMVSYDREYRAKYVYYFRVRSDSGQIANGTLTVNVLDINDNKPEFSSNVTEINVDQTLPKGSPVDTFSVRDKDEGVNAEVTFSISSGNTDDTFTIDNNGLLSLAKALNFDTQDTFQLEITATDKGSSPLEGTTVRIVNVIKNKTQPQFVPVGGVYSAELGEDVALGSTVFALNATENGTASKLRFGIVSGNENGSFQIDPDTGLIRVVKLLDREAMSDYILKVSVTNQYGISEFGTLKINVTDVNDNNPVVHPSVMVFSIPDKTPSGYVVTVLNVTDADLGANGTVTVTIDAMTTANAFRINGFNLETAVAMDYPVINMYRMTMKCRDGGNPTRTAIATIVVYVLNGQIPFFNVTSATVSVLEGRNSGQEIYDVNATDKGAVENGSIVYSLSGSAYFVVRPTTGAVIIKIDLDFETMEQHTLVITAANPTPSNPPVTFTLTVIVINVNEWDPVFYQYSRTFNVKETTPPKTIFGTFLATDADHGSFGEVTQTMTGCSDFKMDPKTGEISVYAVLDFLRKSYYTCTVTATDGGGRIGIASLVLLVDDENTHHPVFTSATVVNVLDSVPVGTDIFHVNAYDLDTGSAGNISYELVNPINQNTFTLDPATGIITTKERLSALTTPSYKLDVRAFDLGTPISLDNTTSILVIIIPTDPNYYDPVFPTNCSTSIIILRKDIPGATVFDCQATDSDKGRCGELRYSITSGNEDGFFSIDYDTGKITTAANLQLAKNSYPLTIQARDYCKPSRNATLKITVIINPAITTGLKIDYNFTIAENAAAGIEVGVITVDDGRTVSLYSIKAGNYYNAFDVTLDGNNGKLVVRSPLDYETYSLYALEILVTSDAADQNIFVEILILDVNDNPPVFLNTSLTFAVPEYSPTGQIVAIISYTDGDATTVNKNNTLSIQSTLFFSIDQAGHLSIAAVLDYETTPKVSFNVIAVERLSPFTTATVAVTVYVIDVEENETRSTSYKTDDAMVSLEAPYPATLNHVVCTFEPQDFGIIPSKTASFRYISYRAMSPFSVHENTGVMTVIAVLELHATYHRWLMLEVTDGGVTTNYILFIRVDIFDLATEVAVIEFTDSYTDRTDKVDQFRSRTQEFFNESQRVGFSDVVDTSTPSRRRLLVQKSAAFTYVVKDTSVDDMANINKRKEFLSEAEILKVLQSNPDGTPVAGLSDPSVADVSVVEPYEEKKTGSDFDAFIQSPAGIAVFVLLGLLLLVLLVLLLTCLFYRKCYNKRSKTKKSKEKDIPTEKAKKKSFSKVEDRNNLFNSNPNIIVSAPPPLSHQTPPPEKPPPAEADNEPTQKTNVSYNDAQKTNVGYNDSASRKPGNEAVRNGLPSQYNGKKNKNKPGKTKVINIGKTN